MDNYQGDQSTPTSTWFLKTFGIYQKKRSAQFSWIGYYWGQQSCRRYQPAFFYYYWCKRDSKYCYFNLIYISVIHSIRLSVNAACSATNYHTHNYSNLLTMLLEWWYNVLFATVGRKPIIFSKNKYHFWLKILIHMTKGHLECAKKVNNLTRKLQPSAWQNYGQRNNESVKTKPQTVWIII